ncbi:Uncharacterised protein [Yersinia pseudotuberculosis]|nr:Uncharacterised protein [Yersinia pseudotuberculosis]
MFFLQAMFYLQAIFYPQAMSSPQGILYLEFRGLVIPNRHRR